MTRSIATRRSQRVEIYAHDEINSLLSANGEILNAVSELIHVATGAAIGKRMDASLAVKQKLEDAKDEVQVSMF